MTEFITLAALRSRKDILDCHPSLPRGSIMTSLLYAGLLGLMFIALSLRVVQLRQRFRVGVSTGNHEPLRLAVRAHANFAEYVPLILVLMALIELKTTAPFWLLHALGLALLLGRFLHGFVGLNRSAGESFGRFVGTALTWGVLVAASALALLAWVGLWLSAS